MILYHGSNVEVTSPRIIVSNRMLDFGPGFYTTSSLEQAERWAFLQAKRRRTGKAVVTVYEFDEKTLRDELKVFCFDAANAEWLNFVAENRKGIYIGIKLSQNVGL